MNGPESQPKRHQSYLWAVGEGVAEKSLDERVAGRFQVVAPHIWLDTQAEVRPPFPDELPAPALPYLRAYPYRLHVPSLYGVLGQTTATSILLLENAPIHSRSGELLPAISDAWLEASPWHQVYWLWQAWELWHGLQPLGLGASLLDLQNLHVEGWRLRLRELTPDREPPPITALAAAWQPLAQEAEPGLRWFQPGAEGPSNLLDLLVEFDSPTKAETFSHQLNQILLRQAAGRRLRISLAGGTDAGPNLPRNEDACYPEGRPSTEGAPRVAIVCDGVGGHTGGDVASRLATQSLQLQLQGLLTEARQQSEPVPPEIIAQQIEAVLRIVNDVISHQNDTQARAGRQRMGTTVVLAVVVPQSLPTEDGWTQVEEVYIAHVGDSRAYWITPDYCHLLTVDDDIASREVMAGRQPLPLAQTRPDAGALTQALGTRSAEHLHPHVQRFFPSETGLLLLCSDGLSDHNRVEQAWANYIGLVVKGIVSLGAAVDTWLQLANQKNGHDNATVVLMFYQVSPKPSDKALATQADLLQSDLTPSSEALLYGETQAEDATATQPAVTRRSPPLWAWIGAILLVIVGVAGWAWLSQRPQPPLEPLPESGEQSYRSR